MRGVLVLGGDVSGAGALVALFLPPRSEPARARFGQIGRSGSGGAGGRAFRTNPCLGSGGARFGQIRRPARRRRVRALDKCSAGPAGGADAFGQTPRPDSDSARALDERASLHRSPPPAGRPARSAGEAGPAVPARTGHDAGWGSGAVGENRPVLSVPLRASKSPFQKEGLASAPDRKADDCATFVPVLPAIHRPAVS